MRAFFEGLLFKLFADIETEKEKLPFQSWFLALQHHSAEIGTVTLALFFVALLIYAFVISSGCMQDKGKPDASHKARYREEPGATRSICSSRYPAWHGVADATSNTPTELCPDHSGRLTSSECHATDGSIVHNNSNVCQAPGKNPSIKTAEDDNSHKFPTSSVLCKKHYNTQEHHTFRNQAFYSVPRKSLMKVKPKCQSDDSLEECMVYGEGITNRETNSVIKGNRMNILPHQILPPYDCHTTRTKYNSRRSLNDKNNLEQKDQPYHSPLFSLGEIEMPVSRNDNVLWHNLEYKQTLDCKSPHQNVEKSQYDKSKSTADRDDVLSTDVQIYLHHSSLPNEIDLSSFKNKNQTDIKERTSDNMIAVVDDRGHLPSRKDHATDTSSVSEREPFATKVLWKYGSSSTRGSATFLHKSYSAPSEYRQDHIVGIKHKCRQGDFIPTQQPQLNHCSGESLRRDTVKTRQLRNGRRLLYGWSENARDHHAHGHRALAASPLGDGAEATTGNKRQTANKQHSRIVFSPLPSPCHAVASIPTKNLLCDRSSIDEKGTSQTTSILAATAHDAHNNISAVKRNHNQIHPHIENCTSPTACARNPLNNDQRQLTSTSTKPERNKGPLNYSDKDVSSSPVRFHAYFKPDLSNHLSSDDVFRNEMSENRSERGLRNFEKWKKCLTVDPQNNIKCMVSLCEDKSKIDEPYTKPSNINLVPHVSAPSGNIIINNETYKSLAEPPGCKSNNISGSIFPLPTRDRAPTPYNNRSGIRCSPERRFVPSTDGVSCSQDPHTSPVQSDFNITAAGSTSTDRVVNWDHLEAPVVCPAHGSSPLKEPTPPTVSLDKCQLVYLYKLSVKKVGVGFRFSPVNIDPAQLKHKRREHLQPSSAHLERKQLSNSKHLAQHLDSYCSANHQRINRFKCLHSQSHIQIPNTKSKRVNDVAESVDVDDKMKQQSYLKQLSDSHQLNSAQGYHIPKVRDLGNFRNEELFVLSSPSVSSKAPYVSLDQTNKTGLHVRSASPHRTCRPSSRIHHNCSPEHHADLRRHSSLPLPVATINKFGNYHFLFSNPEKDFKRGRKGAKDKLLKKDRDHMHILKRKTSEKYAGNRYNKRKKAVSRRGEANGNWSKTLSASNIIAPETLETDEKEYFKIGASNVIGKRKDNYADETDHHITLSSAKTAQTNKRLPFNQRINELPCSQQDTIDVSTLNRLENAVQKLTDVLVAGTSWSKRNIRNKVKNQPKAKDVQYRKLSKVKADPPVINSPLCKSPPNIPKYNGLHSPVISKFKGPTENQGQTRQFRKSTPLKKAGATPSVIYRSRSSLCAPALSPKYKGRKKRTKPVPSVCIRSAGPPRLRTAARAAARTQAQEPGKDAGTDKRGENVKTAKYKGAKERVKKCARGNQSAAAGHQKSNRILGTNSNRCMATTQTDRGYKVRAPLPHPTPSPKKSQTLVNCHHEATRLSPKKPSLDFEDCPKNVSSRRFVFVGPARRDPLLRKFHDESCRLSSCSSLSWPFSVDTSKDVSAAQVFD